jgi:predicted secreted protein
MSKINGTTLLVYCDGTLVASQRNVTVSWEQDLPDATDKDGAGWEAHINGVRRCTVDFDGLYNDTGLSAEEFITYITGRASCMLVIDGSGVPIVGEARIRNIAVNGEKETPATYNGAFTFDGPAWMLTGAYANLMTDPDASGTDYDTMTVSGIKITSAINLAGNAATYSNTIAITSGSVYKAILFLTLNSGQAPSVVIGDVGGDWTNVEQLIAGVNVVTLTATSTATYAFIMRNTAAANWSTSNIYIFKV